MDRSLHRFMIVYDREGHSNDFTMDMWEKRTAVCTYKKYAKGKWDEAEFREHEIENENGGKKPSNLRKGQF